MRSAEHERMHAFEDRYWWFVGRRHILSAMLRTHLADPPPGRGRVIADVGCGTGGLLSLLAEHGAVLGLDPSRPALAWCRRRGFRRLAQSDATRLPLPDQSLDVVTAFDVLEHIADDAAALREIHRVLRPGGQLLLTVPAYPFLWSEHDEVLDHYRRYTASVLRQRLQDAGLQPERLSHCITLLLPAAIVLRVGQRLKRSHGNAEAQCGLIELPPVLNRLCLATLQVEARLLPLLNLPAGVSLVAVATRADESAQRSSPGNAL